MDRPETRYAWNGDVALAYQVVGEGPVDILYLQGYCSNVDMNWESPHLARFLRGLSRVGRVIVMDRRGWGCSDRYSPSDIAPLETLTDDMLAVLEAADSRRATIFATWECGILAMLFAATYPERTHALVLCDAFASYSATDETPWLPDDGKWSEWIDMVHDEWGRPAWSEGEMSDGPERDWFTRYQRGSITPGSAVAEFRRYLATDIRRILPSIQVPTLVLTRGANDADPEESLFLTNPKNGRYLASHIPGARLTEIDIPAGQIHHLHWYGRSEPILRRVDRFLADLREEQASFDRVLATVLFTDIIGSTAKAAELGDHAWSGLLGRHHATVRTLLARYRGHEVDTAGDGFFATFDGPARAVRCATAIAEAVRPLGIEVRAGVHTGEVETIDGKVSGMAVNVGARVGAAAGAGEVLVSQTVKDLTAGSGLVLEDAGEHELKGVPDRWRLYRVVGG